MVQLSRNTNDFSAGFDDHGLRLPARSANRPAAGAKVPVRTHVIGQVVVLEVAGRLSDVVDDLDQAIQSALADVPRGVVCDLSNVFEGAEADAVEVLATAGRHVRDWPGIPVAVVCPDPAVREALRAHPLGGHLIVTASILPAVSAVLATPIPAVAWLRLAPHPTAPSASRDFVTRTLLDWGLGSLIPSASLVVSELVTNSTIHAGTDIALSVSWNLGGLRLTVRDHSPELPRQRFSQLDLHGRGLFVVAGLSRAVGVLPTADGGKVVWAVLKAARPLPPTSPRRPELATTNQQSPVFTDRGPAEWHPAPSPASI
jgi:anti-sigma regulatory factor (Ser/Thr protein kinase)